MTVADIVEAAGKVQAVNIGGMDAADLALTAKTIDELAAAGKVPILFVMPSDVFMKVFDDGDFAENATQFAEIQNRHFKAMFDEYAAWKVLQAEARRNKK